MSADLLTAGERTRLAALAEVIVPRWKAMPSAGEIDLAGAPLDRALEARPDLLAPLRALLAEVDIADPAGAVGRLEREAPEAFRALMQAVAGAYYADPRVWKLLGYGGQQRRPLDEWPKPELQIR